ncbi:methyltransferase family protein [Candidatus Palauibacter sp.]|uniref:methyltransferase family protein n=1 Tax=Candidatus Palauibacter sp. TaxID=3101350 RepID=UPI003AF30DBF
MNPDIAVILFAVDVVILGLLLVGAVASAVWPERRIWPPPQPRSWQYRLIWMGFYAAFGIGAALLFFDWNSWVFRSPLRFVAGIPLTLLGGLLAAWAVATAGWTNTSGVRGRFVSSGPYRFTRNPQYLGDIVFFVGVGFMANSLFVWITHLFLAFIFREAPLAEEPWLEEQYGAEYREYLRKIPRFP